MRSRETRDCVALFLLQLPFLFLPFPLRYTIFIFHPSQNTALRKKGGFPGMRMCNRALWPPGCCFAFLLLSMQHPSDGPQQTLAGSHLPQDENTLSSSCGGTSLNYFPLTARQQRALFAQTSREKDREKNQVENNDKHADKRAAQFY